jgi:hypothetical protein
MHSGEKLMTNSTPTQLLVRKKITAIYADGPSKMNLGIATVVRMLKGATNVPVEVAADAAARNCWPSWPEAPDGPSNGPPRESF